MLSYKCVVEKSHLNNNESIIQLRLFSYNETRKFDAHLNPIHSINYDK